MLYRGSTYDSDMQTKTNCIAHITGQLNGQSNVKQLLFGYDLDLCSKNSIWLGPQSFSQSWCPWRRPQC